jgi:hypothetical protein
MSKNRTFKIKELAVYNIDARGHFIIRKVIQTAFIIKEKELRQIIGSMRIKPNTSPWDWHYPTTHSCLFKLNNNFTIEISFFETRGVY